MASDSYTATIRNDVLHHQFIDSSCPPDIIKFAQSIQQALKIPTWFKPHAASYAEERVMCMLKLIRASDDASALDLWDDSYDATDEDLKQRLCAAFGASLSDCASIRAVIDTEESTQTPCPKESFLVILVRNAILNATEGLFSLEDIPVVLPRHFSGAPNPILKYMNKSVPAPLVISVSEDVPNRNTGDDQQSHKQEDSDCEDHSNNQDESSGGDGEHSSHEEEESSHEEEESDDDESSNDASDSHDDSESSPAPRRRIITLSEFLDAPRTVEEEVEEQEPEVILCPSFDAHFIGYPATSAPPSSVFIPVLCMADEERLPVLISSLLFQRRIWHIHDPLIGIAFTKFDTVIKLYVGWLDKDLSPDRILPRVHIAAIGTSVPLDLSSPIISLAVTHLLVRTQSNISWIRDTVRHLVDAVVVEAQWELLSWRIDTDLRTEYSSSVSDKDTTVLKWITRQQEEISSNLVSKPTLPLVPGTTRSSSPDLSVQEIPSMALIPPPEEQAIERSDDGDRVTDAAASHTASTIPTFMSKMSCSDFTRQTTFGNRIFPWLFNRWAIPRSLATDYTFFKDYNVMTGFIWPTTWTSRKDLPLVDAALEPYVTELLQGVEALKSKPWAITYHSEENFPIDLEILKTSFSAIFQVSRRAREKKGLGGDMCETSWRHDFDRLLFDFFVRRLPSSNKVSAQNTGGDNRLIGVSEDRRCRPTLETTLRFPKSEILEPGIPPKRNLLIMRLLSNQQGSWAEDRGITVQALTKDMAHGPYVSNHWIYFEGKNGRDSGAKIIEQLGQHPDKGKCDALGRLLIELPRVSKKAVGRLSLVSRASTATSPENKGQNTTKPSSDTLALPEANRQGDLQVPDGIPYDYPSASISYSEPPNLPKSDIDQKPVLELPLLAIEYKKASDSEEKGTNQLRMYLTASVKFLQALGITEFPVYGVQTDGPIAVFPAAVSKKNDDDDDVMIHLYERLTERVDISTVVGAWHYATILSRLAQRHALVLEQRFAEVEKKVVDSLKDDTKTIDWTMGQQRAMLQAQGKVKLPKKDSEK